MKSLKVTAVILMLFCFSAVKSPAQCSMCRQGVESNIKQGENKRGRGLNHAILYLMSVPYVLGGIGGFIIWRNYKKRR